jgi:hypothetical protein
MPFRDNSFDFCVDKGTFDALACGPDRELLANLMREMTRVSSVGTILISSGTPERRMHMFESQLEGLYEKIDYFKVEISKLAQLINILRTELKDKPLKDSVKGEKGPEVFKKALETMIRIEKEKQLDANILKFGKMADPKAKLMALMLKAKRKKQQEDEEARVLSELQQAAKE